MDRNISRLDSNLQSTGIHPSCYSNWSICLSLHDLNDIALWQPLLRPHKSIDAEISKILAHHCSLFPEGILNRPLTSRILYTVNYIRTPFNSNPLPNSPLLRLMISPPSEPRAYIFHVRSPVAILANAGLTIVMIQAFPGSTPTAFSVTNRRECKGQRRTRLL